MRKSLPIAFLILTCGLLHSQYIPFDNYTVGAELPNKRIPAAVIFDVEQDTLGYIWIATQNGAFKFDGYAFHPITDFERLPEKSIKEIYIDTKGRIWLATENTGLAWLEDEKLNILDKEHGLVSDRSISLLEDLQHNIWYFTFEGISCIRSDTIINYNEESHDIRGEILSTWLGFDGTIWFSTTNSLYFFTPDGDAINFGNFKMREIRQIAEDKPGSMWFASALDGITHISGNDPVTFTTKNGLLSNNSLSIQSLGPDTVIAATIKPGGIYRIINNTIDRTWSKGLEDVTVENIFVDSKKRIWAKTDNSGVILIEKDKLMHLKTKKENNLVDPNIEKITEDRNGNIWIATQGGLSKYGKVIFHIYNQGLIKDDINILAITEKDGRVFLGTYEGLNILEADNRITQYVPHIESIRGTDIFSILATEKNVWLGLYDGIIDYTNAHGTFLPFSYKFTRNMSPWTTDLKSVGGKLYCATDLGLVLYENHEFSYYTHSDGLPTDEIWKLDIDTSGYIWCATASGLSIFDGKSFHNFGIKDGMSDNLCQDIAFDQNGIAWIATGNGISKVSLLNDWKVMCSKIGSRNGLASDIVYSILIDKQGKIWAGLDKGIARLDPETDKITNYGKIDGFLPVETFLGASTLTSGSEIWFGTFLGAVKYMPENDYVYNDPPRIYIQKVELYDDTTSIDQYLIKDDEEKEYSFRVSLPYNKNNLVFHYVGLHYTIVEKNQYRYILEGYDSKWSEPTHDIRTIPYRHILPGNYTFKVVAANCDGIWTDTPAQYSFEIQPPFWQTWWFRALEGIVFILLLILFIRMRERKLRHDKAVLTQKVKERTIEIEKQRDQIVQQKKEITDSIVYAEKIQTAVLPKEPYINTLLKEYFILFRPRDIVSGDFYWINGKDGRVIVVAADCTGHGVPGAFMSMLGVSILNELASGSGKQTADKILNSLRDHLTKTLRQTGKEEEAKDGMDLALTIIDYNDMKVQFSGAYNPLIHIRKKECTVYKGDKMPVGVHFGAMDPFTCQTFSVKKGDCLYMFSDGYADQFGGPDGKKFKSANLRELLVEISVLKMDKQKVRLNETIENWKGINEQVDDILIVGVRI